jgi:hypothetical protein
LLIRHTNSLDHRHILPVINAAPTTMDLAIVHEKLTVQSFKPLRR